MEEKTDILWPVYRPTVSVNLWQLHHLTSLTMNPALATLLLFLMAALGTGAGSVLQPSGVTSAQQPENDVVPNPRYGPPYLLVRFYDGGKPIRAQPFVKPLLVEPLGYNAQWGGLVKQERIGW